MKVKYIIGAASIITIVGGTVYFIKKRRDKNKVEEKPMTAEEAMALAKSMDKLQSTIEENGESIAERYGHRTREEIGLEPIDMDKLREDCHDMTSWNMSFHPSKVNEEFEDEDDINIEIIDSPKINDGVTFDEEELDTPLAENLTEEDLVLRHDPNSREARNQFIKMELAEWAPLEDTYQIMLNLFEFPFNPINDGDWDLKTRIIDHRVQFFGFQSKWAQDVTYADVIMHYARNACFNCDETVRYWVEYFLDFNEFDVGTHSRKVDSLLERLNSHTYFNEERQTFGLFGLTRNGMDQAIKIANRNIDRSVTYEIEFNEFLKSCI